MTAGNETIFAPATAPGKSGVAVLRISGPRALQALAAFGVSHPAPRIATLADLRYEDRIIDRALALYFPAPHSFTGDDVVELHTHGSRAVIQALISALSEMHDFRLAEPGEFSRRAFLNGKMDLTEAEGLADLIDAETEAQRKQAFAALSGTQGKAFEQLRLQALKALARLEAVIDFPDEDIPPATLSAAEADAADLHQHIARLLADNRAGERLRDGITIVILGAPNAGKSSLLNALARRDAAIVSPTPGTTRDIIEVPMDIGGYAVTLVDTAGLRESTDAIEQEGIRRARTRAEAADVKLILFDGSCLPELPPESLSLAEGALIAVSKSDALAAPLPAAIDGQPPIAFSATTGHGIPGLLEALELAASTLCSNGSLITRQRHRHALAAANAHLERFSTALPLEIACEELRRAATEIGKITGKIVVDELLDRVFSEFCIGK